MKPALRLAAFALAPVLCLTGLSACRPRDRTPGEQLDRALEKTGEAVKDAGEAIKPK